MPTMFMEKTKVSAERTASEINGLLATAGAVRTMTEYDPNTRTAIGVTFSMMVNGNEVLYRLPVRVAAVQNKLRKSNKKLAWDADQVKAIAWRQAFRWIQAQLALIDTGMVVPAEVFMPYALDGANRTMFEVAMVTTFKALPAPEKADAR